MLCWWRPCRVLLSVVGQEGLWGTPSAKQLLRGRCAPRPSVPPTPGRTPREAGWNIVTVITPKYAAHSRCNLLKCKGVLKLTRLNHTCRTLFLELPTRKIPTVCKPKPRWRCSLSANIVAKMQPQICSDRAIHKAISKLHFYCITFPRRYVHTFFIQCYFFNFDYAYRVFRGVGSRDPRLWAPVCKLGWGWAFCHGASSCCQLPLLAETVGGPPRAATGYHQGQWCNPQILRPVRHMGENRTVSAEW